MNYDGDIDFADRYSNIIHDIHSVKSVSELQQRWISAISINNSKCLNWILLAKTDEWTLFPDNMITTRTDTHLRLLW